VPLNRPNPDLTGLMFAPYPYCDIGLLEVGGYIVLRAIISLEESVKYGSNESLAEEGFSDCAKEWTIRIR
jgi:hypothetical protein